jgi:hypothetical protein
MANLYEACHQLFVNYPLAAEVVNHDGRIIQWMVLMLQEVNDAEFFVLSHDSGRYTPFCSLRPWGAGEIVNVEADGWTVDRDLIVKALDYGCPIPQDGSVFGWNDKGIINVLMTFRTKQTPLPSFMSMPFATLSEVQWPPCASKPFFGHWFWDSYKDGEVVPLGGLIAEIPGTVYWVDTRSIFDSYCCVVARDVKSRGGPKLRRGPYVFYRALQTGISVPRLKELLAYTNKVDLAPQFQLSE